MLCKHSKQLKTPLIQSLAHSIGLTPDDLEGVHSIDSIPMWFTDQSPRVKFVDRPIETRTALHWGQLKLLIHELKVIQEANTNLVVYAGAAPGDHIPFLAELFPQVHFILYDPSPFCTELIENPPSNVTVRCEYFTNDTAYEMVDSHNEFAFISDIRTKDGIASRMTPAARASEPPTEEFIEDDMANQYTWVKIMAASIKLASLKFRLNWGKGYTTYLDGKILIPTFAPLTSTETRLIITSIKDKVYDNLAYEQMCAYHNSIGRALMYDVPQYDIPGLDNCYDCAMLVKFARMFAPDEDIEGFIKRMIFAVGGKKRNLSTKYSKSTTKRLYRRGI